MGFGTKNGPPLNVTGALPTESVGPGVGDGDGVGDADGVGVGLGDPLVLGSVENVPVYVNGDSCGTPKVFGV